MAGTSGVGPSALLPIGAAAHSMAKRAWLLHCRPQPSFLDWRRLLSENPGQAQALVTLPLLDSADTPMGSATFALAFGEWCWRGRQLHGLCWSTLGAWGCLQSV